MLSNLKVWGLGSELSDLCDKAKGSGFVVDRSSFVGLGFRVQGLGFKV
jgi:hypothetical protein